MKKTLCFLVSISCFCITQPLRGGESYVTESAPVRKMQDDKKGLESKEKKPSRKPKKQEPPEKKIHLNPGPPTNEGERQGG